MDGTLIDSEPYWIAAETELASRYDVPWSHEDGLQFVGNPLPVSARVLQERGVALSEDEIIGYLLMRVREQVVANVPWQADARALLNATVSAGIPCALVTMSYTSLAQALVAAAPDAFSVIVTGDRVTRGKPDPEAFLTAADELGVDITRCVAFEDSPAGVASAWTSGARTVGIRRLIPIEQRDGLSRVQSLEGWDVDTVRRIAAGDVIDELGDSV